MKQSTSSADKQGRVGAMSTQDDASLREERGRDVRAADPNAPTTEAERTGGGHERGPKETQHSTDSGERKDRTNAPASGQPSGGTTAPKK